MFAGTFNSSNGCLTAVVDGVVYSVDKSHPNYNSLLKSYKEEDKSSFVKLYEHVLSQKTMPLQEYVDNSGITFQGDRLFYNGVEQHNSYVDRIAEARKEGFPIQPMVNFFKNLLQNPSSRSVNELPDFLMNKNLPLTEDGCFLAYKSVQSDWYSKSSGTLTLLQGSSKDGKIYNAVGETIECVRNEVDDERGHECSKGLHVGGLQYSGPGGWYNNSGDKVVVVKVNPKDVVSVPKDHNAQKVRVCKYEVVNVYETPLNSSCHNVVANPVPVVEKEITVEDIADLDMVTFKYKGKNDSDYVQRFALVEEATPEALQTILLPDDPSYEEGNETRKFLKCNIKDVEFLED